MDDVLGDPDIQAVDRAVGDADDGPARFGRPLQYVPQRADRASLGRRQDHRGHAENVAADASPHAISTSTFAERPAIVAAALQPRARREPDEGVSAKAQFDHRPDPVPTGSARVCADPRFGVGRGEGVRRSYEKCGPPDCVGWQAPSRAERAGALARFPVRMIDG